MMSYNGLYNNPNQFDLGGPSTNSPFQPGLPNGNQTSTSGYPNQTFAPPASVIPQKRPHDGSMPSGSPTPSQMSRPQNGAFPSQPGQQFPSGATPYAHLQQQPGSAQATPSPTLQNQQFRQPSQQPRMQNASPSPFTGQQPGNFGNTMSPAPNQNQGQPGGGQPQSTMGGFNAQYGMNQNMGMPANMANVMNNAQGNQLLAQRQYQMRLMQQQAALRQQNGGLPQQQQQQQRPPGAQQNPMFNPNAMQQGGVQMANGQGGGQMAGPTMQQQQQQMKRAQFLKQCAAYTMQAGRQFNPTPMIGQKPVDLYNVFTLVVAAQGSSSVERNNQWPAIAVRLGISGPGYENAGEQLKQIYFGSVAMYEKAWLQARQSQKQEQARQQAHQMAGYGPTAQASPTKSMPPPSQQNQMAQYQQAQQQAQQAQQAQHAQQNQAQAHATPVQANASIAQNGMSTPQQVMGGLGTIAHRRNSSMRKPDGTPTGMPGAVAPSPSQKVQRSPSVKQEPAGAVMRSDEPQSSNYVPQTHQIETDGGYDLGILHELGASIQRAMPQMPSVDEMGIIDTRAIALSLASGIHGEVRYALDALAIVSMDQRISFDLEKCDDLIDVVIDCAEDQTELLSEDAAEVSDALDLPSYESVVREAKNESDTLQEVPEFGTQAYELDRAADKLIAITTILRNFSFYEHNHRLLTTSTLVKWLSNTIRLLGTRHMLLRTNFNTLDFYKDMVIFLSNITQSLELPSRDDALHMLHFLLAFAPQPTPSYTESKGHLRFASFVPSVHRYLPPAIDCLAKLLARQDPNRVLYKSIFTASSSSVATSEQPLDLLTRAFALSISVLPDRSRGPPGNSTQLRIVEARKAYLTQGMLAADILTTLAPSSDSELARSWIESEDNWASSLVSLASLLSVEPPQRHGGPKGMPQPQWDIESFRLISYRSLMMIRRLAEKAGRNTTRSLMNGFTNGTSTEGTDADHDGIEKADNWDGIPQGHNVIGALMLPNCDKVSLGLLCGLHEMAMRD